MINPVLITPAGLKVYRDGDFDLHARRNAKGNIYLPCDLSDHKDKKRKRLRINLNSGFIRCMDPACVQNGILESKYNEWMQFHVKKCRKYSAGQKPRLDKMIKICSPEVIRYLKEERGIEDISLLDEMGIREIDWYYDGETARSLIFPFYVGDEIVNYQVKRADGKRGFRMSNGMPMLYNINAATGQSEVFITEGEMDAVALTCCGFKNVISVANGAGTSQECFDNCKEYLASVETYYLATDMDEVGEGYRDKLIRMLGAANCRMVKWRWMDEDGWHEAKDANETLKKGGKPAVESCVRSSVPCPVPNLVRASDVKEMVMHYYYHGRPVGKTLGMGSFDNYVKFQTGRMYVVSGQPGTGKTTLIDYWLIRADAQ
jgi:5S rRNA maturation endonuclease (ribonuclease M5)